MVTTTDVPHKPSAQMDACSDRGRNVASGQLSPLRLFPGAALAVYRHGELALDLIGGYADTQRGELGTSRFALPALLRHQAVRARSRSGSRSSAGKLALDDRVADHWPASQPTARSAYWSGTSSPTAADSRRLRRSLTRDRWGDWEAAMRAIAAMPLEHEPGHWSAPTTLLTQHWVMRRAGPPARWPCLRRLPARGDHAARSG